MTFALLIDWVSSAYHQEIWSGIQAACREQGINLLSLVTGRPGSPFRWEKMRNQLLEFLDGQQFDGFLFMTATLGNHLNQDQLLSLVAQVAPAPVVSIGAELDGVPSVVVDHRRGFEQVLDHLYEVHGYRRFAYAGGPPYSEDARVRRQRLEAFLEKRGLPQEPQWLLEGDFSPAWGHRAVDQLVPGSTAPFQVLVCANDDIATGALEALAQKGLQVPGDVAVTGFDDVPTAELAALTTSRQPLRDLGVAAALRLLEAVRHSEAAAGPPLRLDAQPVIRQSCGCLSPAARTTRVEPRSETPLRFADWARESAEGLLDELTAEGLDREHARALSEAFVQAWALEDSRRFLHPLRSLLNRLNESAVSPNQLHYPLSVLRRAVLRATEPATRRAWAESTIHQARILLTEAMPIQAVQKETRQLLVKDLLSDLNERLVYARDFDEQAGILLDAFPKLGIGEFRLTLYDDQAHPMEAAHLVVTERGQEPGNGIAYRPREVFPPSRLPSAEPWCWVAEALFDREAPLGFFLLDAQGPSSLLTVFDQLCERVGRGLATVRRIQALEGQVAERTIQLEAALSDLEQRNAALKDLALRDEMTGLYNRRGFLTLAEHQVKGHYRRDQTLTLFFADLDGLKLINDTQGHDAGDNAIRTAARLLSATFRAEDIVARLGGDEFVVLAPGCSPDEAGSLAQRLDEAFQGAGDVRISVGWTAIDPKTQRPLTAWLRDADERLYREKQRKKATPQNTTSG